MKHQNRLTGYCFAAFTVVVWGSTFISSKVLLEFYTPAQIMLTRFILAYCALWLLRPRRLALTLKQEGVFFLLGLLGCTAYFYTENTALSYTLASNVSIIVAAAPIFTAILAHFAGEERFRASTLAGFLVAFSGVILVVCNGTFVLKLNPKGDLLALAAAVCWAIYSVLLRRASRGLDSILVTRRTMFWGIVTALPLVAAEGVPYPMAPLMTASGIANFLFLGLVGSALCFVLWNKAFRILGVVTTNTFIYLMPFITIVAARIFLDEPISPLALLGAVLITAGVVLSQRSSPAEKAQRTPS
ncbi:DMT family transporter [uncultured Oscillibacter sp.]|uniref:DMT family transporter n=1 Tax=uncultured Oscillibacter sp. TaxID=876091 RepID=UPI00280AE77B|nr:DMT family transporter [uncultured Oscillibacter sp.]